MSKILNVDVEVPTGIVGKWKIVAENIGEAIARVLAMGDKYQIADSILGDDLDALTINVRLLPSGGVKNV